MTSHSNHGSTPAQVRQKMENAIEEGQQQATELASQAQQRAKAEAAKRKSQAASQLDDVAQAFRQTGQQLRHQDKGTLADYSEKVAEQVERVTGYLDEKNVDQILADAEDFARRQPELFLGSAFTLGLLAARFIKSSRQRRRAEYFEGQENEHELVRYGKYGRQRPRRNPYHPPASTPSPRGRYDPS